MDPDTSAALDALYCIDRAQRRERRAIQIGMASAAAFFHRILTQKPIKA